MTPVILPLKIAVPVMFTADLQAVSLPALLMHGEDDQVVLIDASARKAIDLLPNGTLKTYPGLSHGLSPPIPTSSMPIYWRSESGLSGATA